MHFRIHTPPHTLFAAQVLCKQLEHLDHCAEIVTEIDRKDRHHIYIIFNAAAQVAFPPFYIVFQTEISGSPWFTPRYQSIIDGALAVWEYSEYNLAAYDHPKRCIVSPGIDPQSEEQLALLNPSGIRDIPVLFYGWINGSPRRRRILDQLKAEGIPILEVSNTLCHDLWKLLARTKVVLNLHYYDFSPLETFRVNEALSFGCKVVSELPQEHEKYNDIVYWGHTLTYLEQMIMLALNISLATIPTPVNIKSLGNLDEVKAGLALLGM